MLPYLKDMAEIAHKKGTPMVRHLLWEYPQDYRVHELDYEYMFGSDLLVKCIVEEKRECNVYLPEGEWIDFWNRDKEIEGQQTIKVEVPIWKIPLYIKKGSKYDFERPALKFIKK